jgi:chloramphenicol-sensitive protein RarD
MNSVKRGYALVIAAYISWGVLPIFWSLLSNIDPMTVLYQRTVWSALLLGMALFYRGELKDAFQSMLSWKQFRATCLSTLCLGVNWFSYVWAMKHRELFAASLAYYICPLLTMAGAAFVFKERLSGRKWGAIVLLLCGVSLPAVASGEVPLLALIIAASWSVYTLTRRYYDRPALAAIFCETLTLGVVLSVLLAALRGTDTLLPPQIAATQLGLCALSGFVTAVPILLLMEGIRVVPLQAVGMLQYIVPTLSLICSVLYFGIDPSSTQLASLALIWCGLLVFFSADLALAGKSIRRRAVRLMGLGSRQQVLAGRIAPLTSPKPTLNPAP